MLEKTLESPLDCKEIQPVNPQLSQSWIVIGRTDVKAETLILWPPDAKNRLIGKDSEAGQDWRQEEKGTKEDEMIGWHHWLDGHEFEQALGVGNGQASLLCCSSWGCKELDTTAQLNWTETIRLLFWKNHLASKGEQIIWNPLGGSVVKNPSASRGETSSIPGGGRFAGVGNDNPL